MDKFDKMLKEELAKSNISQIPIESRRFVVKNCIRRLMIHLSPKEVEELHQAKYVNGELRFHIPDEIL